MVEVAMKARERSEKQGNLYGSIFSYNLKC